MNKLFFEASEMTFMTPSAIIIKHSLSSTVFWKRHLNSATRQILHWNIVAFDEASSQLGDASNRRRVEFYIGI